MSRIPSRHLIRAFSLLVALLCTSLAACGTNGDAAGQHSLTIGLTYIPNVQFAPFYVAQSLGYYKDAGLQVTLNHHAAAEDEFGALIAGHEDVIIASGDEVLQVRDKGQPVTYIANLFTTAPVTLIVPANSPIHTLADLRGHSIGVPGPYGATYIGLLALLQSAGLHKTDVTIQSISYTQVSALLGGKVDAVMGYSNNEPVQLQEAGFATRTFPVADVQPFISNGLAALRSKIDARTDDIKKVITATLRGQAYIAAHPDKVFAICQHYIPGLIDSQQITNAHDVLAASLPLWKLNSTHLGYTDPAGWQAMANFMLAQGFLTNAGQVTGSFSNDYLPTMLPGVG